MRNQPKYKLFKNASYAFSGLIDVYKNESSFRIEVLLFTLLSFLLLFLNIPFWAKSVAFISLFFPLIVEILNSAIERNVDLVTTQIHPLAKQAKDAAAAAVFISLIVTFLIWTSLFIHFYS